jgi:CubicO group peptidase (beta-lactamase class C family)
MNPARRMFAYSLAPALSALTLSALTLSALTFAVAVADAAAAAPAAHALERTDAESWLDGFMPYALETGDVAGAVVVVVKNGETVLAKGYGYSDVAAHIPVDPEHTLFRPGSTSKLFTWTAVMQLVEQGKLDLDRDVNAYLDFRLPDRGAPITLRNIMTHTAGFEEKVKDLIADDPARLVPLRTYVAEGIPARIFKAGTTPAYSNYATALAGYIVQRVSGQSFDDYVDAHIFKPLGMTHSSFRQPLPEALAADAAKGYDLASQPAKAYEIVNGFSIRKPPS